MKASEFGEQILNMVQEQGDFDVLVASDPEGNRSNTPYGMCILYVDKDDPENLYESREEAELDTDDIKAVLYVSVY